MVLNSVQLRLVQPCSRYNGVVGARMPYLREANAFVEARAGATKDRTGATLDQTWNILQRDPEAILAIRLLQKTGFRIPLAPSRWLLYID